jgi:DNA polymerase-1
MWCPEFNVKFLPTIHPASILHGNIQSEVWIERDIRKAVRCCETPDFTPFEEPEIFVAKTIPDVEHLIKVLYEQEEFAFDLETSGLNMFEEGAHILCVSFSWDKKKAGVIPLDHPENSWDEQEWLYIVDLLEGLFTGPIRKIGQNVKFDAKWLEAILKFKVNNITFDTMLAHYSFFEYRGTQGLKQMAADYLNFPEYNLETEYLKGISKNKRYFGMVPLDPLCKYAAMDANATFRLKELFQRELIKAGTSNVFKTLLMPLSRRLTEMEMLGIKIDTVYLTQLQKDIEEKLANIDAELLTYPSGMQLKEWCTLNKKTLNFNSDAHIRVLLFQFEGLKSIRSTPTGMPSVSQEVLEQMDTQNPIIALLLERSHLATLYDNFIEKTWAVIDDGKVHPSYKIHGTETGRLSCENPNYQQIPREGYIKKMFVGDSAEFLYMDADYSQIELRVIAGLSGDRSMREIFGRGEDIHTAMASKIFNKPLSEVTKDERYRAKTMNFSILYGKGAYSVAMDLGITPEEAKVFIEQFFKEVPGVQRWIKDTQNVARKTGMVKSPFGRLRHIPEVRSTDRERAAKSLREAVNMPVQSAASDITATAFLKLADIFEENKFKSRLVGLIHDSISVVVHKKELDRVIPIVKQTMEGFKLPWMGSVPIVVEIKIGKSWGEIEAIAKKV